MKTRNLNKFAGLLLAMLITPISGIADSAKITIDVVSKDEFVLFLLKNDEYRGFQCSEIRVQAKVVDKDGRVARRSIIALDVAMPANSLEIRLEAGKEVIAALRNEMNQPRIVDVSNPQYRCEPKTVYVTADKKVFRDRLQDGSLGPEMVWIPAGRFRMGDIQGGGYRNEKPVHWVSVDKFAMGRYEVTVAEFRRFVNATGYRTDAEKEGSCWWDEGKNWRNLGFSQTDTHPVVCVSWNDATAYTEWLSKQTGHTYRLSTEVQWEYADRAGSITKYWWGNTASHEYANYGKDQCCEGLAKGKDSWVYTSPVGSFAANPFGLYDTVGNVWEWTCSEYEDKYSGKEQRCANRGSRLVLRGGSWSTEPRNVRAATRGIYSHGVRNNIVGFRLAKSS
ncbi:MAG: hypothetical protein DRR08_26515 [Candidatus Parabeggiatoa sp. nov. 2]|nr:MAG: hypothetical protein B6247_29700 [Beggiatoa sp. 4572_84]RKZ54353.1 MAG: hypothetical protein DRR08_26515 [Gammaproteobacteria bacterium]HEC85540.1 formylglycine-generating enzyme family protein [Thioploca sp.]